MTLYISEASIGVCGQLLLIFAYLTILVTFPFSLLVCIKVLIIIRSFQGIKVLFIIRSFQGIKVLFIIRSFQGIVHYQVIIGIGFSGRIITL